MKPIKSIIHGEIQRLVQGFTDLNQLFRCTAQLHHVNEIVQVINDLLKLKDKAMLYHESIHKEKENKNSLLNFLK